MIERLKIKKLVVHGDGKGDFKEILRHNEGLMSNIAPISIGKTEPGIIKAFHWHKYQDDIFHVPKGEIKLVIYDPRNDSPTKGETQVLIFRRLS